MTIASGGTLGTGANSTNNSSYTFNTATNSLASGDVGFLVSVSDNTSTTDGNNNEHTSVTGGTGTWTKLGEHTNSNGAAAAGVTVSVWLFEATGTNSTGTTITLNFGSNRQDKCCSFWKFTRDTSKTLTVDTEPGTNPIANDTDGSNGFGSVAFSGLTNRHRMYFRGLAKEANSTTNISPVSPGFGGITAARSRNNAAAVLARGEYSTPATSTGATSDPTLAVSGDTAGLFLTLIEEDPPVSGSMAATESGSDTAAMSGGVEVSGSITATESGADTAAITGGVEVEGTLAATESGADTASFSGTVEWPEITGSMAAVESGSDTFAASGNNGEITEIPLYPLADLPVADIPVEANEVLGVLLTSLGLDQIVTGKVQVKAASSDVLFTGSATGTVQVKAASINSLGLNSTETGKVIVKGVESNTLNLGWSAAGQVIVKGLSSQSLNLGHSATAGVLAEGSAVNGLNLTWSAAGTVADKVWTEESAESDTWTGDSVESSTWTPDALAASSWSSDAAGGGGWVEDAAETNSWTEDLSI